MNSLSVYGSSGATMTLAQAFNQLRCTSALIGSNGGKGVLAVTGGSFTNTALTIGNSAGELGTITLSGAGSFSGSQENIGNAGNGTFIQNGGTHVAAEAQMGNIGTASGFYLLNGGTASISDFYLAAGTFNTATVSMNGGSFTSATMHVGYQSLGTFTQSNGSSNFSNYIRIGEFSNATGTVSVSGGNMTVATLAPGWTGAGTFNAMGGLVTVTGSMLVGNSSSASGFVNISASGGMNVNLASTSTLGNSGTCQFVQTAGGFVAGTINLAAQAGAHGLASIGGGAQSSLFACNSDMFVGGSSSGQGGNGTLNILANGVVNVAGTLHAYSTGRINLNGGSLTVGNLDVAQDYSRLNWTSGTLTINTQPFIVSNTFPSPGGGASLGGLLSLATGQMLRVGTTYISGDNYAFVTVHGGAKLFTADAYVGYGVVAVIGDVQTLPGATWTNSGDIDAGGDIDGSLYIDGGTLTCAGSVLVAHEDSEHGTANFDDASAIANITGDFIVGQGQNARANIEISHGAKVTNQNAKVAPANGSVVQIDVKSGATWISNSRMDIGGFGVTGAGTLTVSGGAALTVAGPIYVNPTGILQLAGGTISAGQLNVYFGTFDWQYGALNLTNSDLAIGSTGSFGSSITVTRTKPLSVSGNAILDGGATLIIDGGTFSTGTLGGATGGLDFRSGTFNLTSVIPMIGPGGPFGSTLNVNPGQSWNVPNGVEIIAGGHLNLAGGLISAGEFQNQGLITGNGLAVGNLSNLSGARLEVLSGQEIGFAGSHTNYSGATISLLGGTARFDGNLTNAGQITGNGNLVVTGALINSGTLSGRGVFQTGGIGNTGTMQFSAGFSDVYGALLNSKKITVTGGSTTTFYNDVDTTAGSITVNNSSTVVFLGDLTGQSKVFTVGSGTVDFEAAHSGGAILAAQGSVLIGPGSIGAGDSISAHSLAIYGTTSITASGSPANVSRVNSLFVSGGKLDLNDNDLIVDYTGASPLASIAAAIASGYNAGSWNGTGIASTSAAMNLMAHKTALGYAEASTVGISAFDGQSVGSSSVLVRYTYVGDANLDGIVNALDFNALATNFGGGAGKFWNNGDFNYDGVTNTADFTALAQNFGQTLSAPALGTLVPEPTLFALAMPALLLPTRLRSQARKVVRG